jgi:uncharacterized protein
MDRLRVTTTPQSVRFLVHAKPKAQKSRIGAAREDGALDVALAAQPVNGEANQTLLAFLAKTLGVPKRDVQLVRGDTSREKLVEVLGVTEAELRARLQHR